MNETKSLMCIFKRKKTRKSYFTERKDYFPTIIKDDCSMKVYEEIFDYNGT
jgi:hypothetical protein